MPSRDIDHRQRLLDHLSQRLDQPVNARVERLIELRRLVQMYIIDQLSESLNEHIASAPQQSIEQKRMLVREVNRWLRDLGLAVLGDDSKTGNLYIKSGAIGGKGSFAVEHSDGTRTLSTPKLTHVKLVTHQRKDYFVDLWTQRTRSGPSTADRSRP